ncbi:hypothetical protein K3556_12160 [Aliiroseovarius sp. M344]|uniref:hypothetical protein n=1 Tax=Aliiroseovarius sp. M344 TaxID=2867010 RepID=UPI0021AD74E9|nr:hypothetical protein [Aliiroseovarius sp. M344]UWQ13677.1 hypothetical protein K3556_12160 [Aliiroseovarius sp. M344]
MTENMCIGRLISATFCVAAFAAQPVVAEMSLGEMMTTQLDMFGSEPCFDLMVLQDNFSNSNTLEFEKVMFWHSYVIAVGDTRYPDNDDRFIRALRLLAEECLKNPTKPISEIVRQVSN